MPPSLFFDPHLLSNQAKPALIAFAQMPSTQRPPTLDPIAVDRWQRNAPAVSPWLHEEIARRMLDRLSWIKRQPARWSHWGAVRGGLQIHAELARRFAKSSCFVVEEQERLACVARKEIAIDWWNPKRLGVAKPVFEAPPLASCDMVWANMQLHEVADPQSLLMQWHTALAVDGFLMFSCLGPDTAREVHALYAAMGWPVAGAKLTDMHDWGDMLVAAGFAEPVMDMERITLSFETAERLLKELAEIGRNVHPARFQALRGRGWRRQLIRTLEEQGTRDAAGKLILTFEVVYGHAIKAPPKIKMSPLSSVSVADMRSMLGKAR